jgi:Sec-independent protein secretion pathway component TatC
LKFIHLITAVFMSVPLYNLIVVNERGKMGRHASTDVDRYFENIIRGGAARCFVFQMTVLVTGVILLVIGSLGLSSIWTDPVIALKTLFLVALTVLLSHVNFNLQPRIDSAIENASEPILSDEILSIIGPLRIRRKKMAAFCLFLLIGEIILGAQVYSRFGLFITIVLFAAGAIFCWRAYRSRLRFGWI